ncbi:glycosyltransferase [Crenobacter cavernae]|uniref:Glycosyltransferase n=2 Tax=Crenobacter cavernae TaxID=2290923 RepID=A0A345Y7M6_9NEIS|nr:glycosyltransferase [Crenobacter cavernae]
MCDPLVPPYLLGLHAAERPADPLVSCVVPAYNESANIVPLLETLHRLLNADGYRHELIVVDDGSRDDTVERVLTHNTGLPVKLVQLSRNFGKEVALTAGLEHAVGDAVVLIDADFQHPPEKVTEFLARWREGYDMVYSVRDGREDETLAKRCFTRAFYALINLGVPLKIPENTQDFRVLDRRIVDALGAMPERSRFMKGLYNWTGFTQLAVETRTGQRAAGHSSFNFWRLFGLAMTGLTSFSVMPLRVWTAIGALISLSSILYAAIVFVDTLINGNPERGWPTLAVAVCFLGGIQLLSIGILGEYVGRIFQEVKRRPTYLVSRVVTPAEPGAAHER